ncbi:MAG: DNA alkylation repair protein [Myxococcales bacterium]|nr:DNA alkylation repair protein [Myxococcales bacterium]
MAEALKDFFSAARVRELGEALGRVHPQFPVAAFVRSASRGLTDLELVARARHIAAALARHLPPRYEDAVAVLLTSLGPEHTSDELLGVGMAPFFYMPHLVFVAEHGLDHFELSMAAQRELTKRFTAEFSIRAFLERHPERTLAVLREWASDPNPHVRRLVSEGTRPRLPWAPRVRWLEEHPERLLPLLERLKDDPTPVVRRSVANHLNDLGKARPALLFDTCRAWLVGASAARRALVQHALRSAAKRGEAGALDLLGHGARPRLRVAKVRFEPPRTPIGGKVRVTFTLVSEATAAQALRVDLAVLFVKARGDARAKVFNVARVELDAGARVELAKTVSLAVHSTRVPRPGVHAVEARVNGAAFSLGDFVVLPEE